MDNAIHDDGEQLIRYVAAITHEEVEAKRRNMRELAPIMQWGWCVLSLSFFISFSLSRLVLEITLTPKHVYTTTQGG